MASQWDAYVKSIKDNAQGHCDRATILGLNGGGSWISETCPGVSSLRKYSRGLHTIQQSKLRKNSSNGTSIESKLSWATTQNWIGITGWSPRTSCL